MARESQRVTKEELREDQFVDRVFEWAEFVKERSKYFLGGLVAVVIVVMLINVILDRQEQTKLAAAALLGDMAIAEANGEAERALQLNEELLAEYGGTPAAAKGIVMLANRYFGLGRYPEARELYERYVDLEHPLDVFEFAAWQGIAACLAAQGLLSEAAEKCISFATARPQGAPAALALQQAATYHGIAGEVVEHQKVLKRISRDYPTTAAAIRAREHLDML